MMYSTNSYKVRPPYSIWYDDIVKMRKYVEERCTEIKSKYQKEKEDFLKTLDEKYYEGIDIGHAYCQHDDPSLEIWHNMNSDLIALEREIKSTMEIILKKMIIHYNYLKDDELKEMSIHGIMDTIAIKSKIDISKQKRNLKRIKSMIRNRNNSEHLIDVYQREINIEYILSILKSVNEYLIHILEGLYKKSKTN